jgi:hypothetical protein
MISLNFGNAEKLIAPERSIRSHFVLNSLAGLVKCDFNEIAVRGQIAPIIPATLKCGWHTTASHIPLSITHWKTALRN